MKYTIKNRIRTGFVFFLLVVIVAGVIALAVSWCRGEDLTTCWVMCQPGSQVNVRRTPSKRGQEVGYLDACDDFLTDGTSKNGYIRVYGIGEYGEGWIYAGYVSTEEPEPVFERYVCCAKGRVAIRRWMNGPKVERSPWLASGSNVDVFYWTEEWCCTSRGFIKSQYLECDPR